MTVLGLVSTSPSTVRTGCGREVPYARTSCDPDWVTCPHCRDHAVERYRAYADTVERTTAPQSPLKAEDGRLAADRLRGLANLFAHER